MPALEQIRGIIGPFKYLQWDFLNDVNLNTLTFFAKVLSGILDWVQNASLQVDTRQHLKFKRGYHSDSK